MNINLDNFNNATNPMYVCGTDVENTEHFLLRCHFYRTLRLKLLENLEKIDPNFLNLNLKYQVHILSYGYRLNKPKRFNQSVFENVISYVKATARFNRPLVSIKQ